MSKKGPASPTKAKLQEKAKDLPPLENIMRERISGGDQSLILSNGENSNTVLLITDTATAKHIELLRQKLRTTSPLIEVPTLRGVNVDLVSLINPKPDLSKETYNVIKKSLSLQRSALLTQNVIYELPRRLGNINNLEGVYFKEDAIANLEKTLDDTVTLLHKLGLTHNDICAKNVLFFGTPPNLVFRLCDWGSLTESDPIREAAKYRADLAKIRRVVDKAKTILAKREKLKEKAMVNPAFAISYELAIKRKGLSPLKPDAPAKQEANRAPAKVRLNLLERLNKEKHETGYVARSAKLTRF